MKQLFYFIAIVVLMIIARRVMAKVKDAPTAEDLKGFEDDEDLKDNRDDEDNEDDDDDDDNDDDNELPKELVE